MIQRRWAAGLGRMVLAAAAATLGSPRAAAQEKGVVMIEIPVPPRLAENLRTVLKGGFQEEAEASVSLKSGDRTMELVHKQAGHIQGLDGPKPVFIMGLTAVRPDPPVGFTGHPVDLAVTITVRLIISQAAGGFRGFNLIHGKINLSEAGYADFKEMVETQGALLCTPGTTMERGVYHLVCKPLGISPEAFAAHQAGAGEGKDSGGAVETKGSAGAAENKKTH